MIQMERHVAYHLKWLALFALPIIDEDKDDLDGFVLSSDSRQVVQHQDCQSSAREDFSGESDSSFLYVFSPPPVVYDRPLILPTLEMIQLAAKSDGRLGLESDQGGFQPQS